MQIFVCEVCGRADGGWNAWPGQLDFVCCDKPDHVYCCRHASALGATADACEAARAPLRGHGSGGGPGPGAGESAEKRGGGGEESGSSSSSSSDEESGSDEESERCLICRFELISIKDRQRAYEKLTGLSPEALEDKLLRAFGSYDEFRKWLGDGAANAIPPPRLHGRRSPKGRAPRAAQH